MDEHMEKVAELSRCELFIFDLDGTVYEETSHFIYYGQQLAQRLASDTANQYLMNVEQVLSGAHTLTYGSSYDPVTRLIVKGGKAYSWDGQEPEISPSNQLIHVDDPWSVYGVTASQFGIAHDDIQGSFGATREHMESAEFTMRGLPGLRSAIDHLRSAGRKFVIATNSPEPDSRVLLEKLGLTGAFEDHVFNAKKQDRATEHFTRWQQKFQVPFERMVSIGDHYRNEIKPATDLGMKTLYIDRYICQPQTGLTVRVSRPSEVATVLEAVYNLL
jgi:FMN phosphatase YigB (HAD superfamily)